MTTNDLSTLEAKEKFTELINHVSHTKERIKLVRRGKSIAALVPIEDLEFLENIQDKSDLNDAIEALKEARDGGSISLEQFKEEIGV